MTERILPSREELQKEFREAKIFRDVKRALEVSGINISIEAVKATIVEYERLHSEPTPGNDSQEIVIDGDMVKAHLSDDSV
jgi:hypothetical protein